MRLWARAIRIWLHRSRMRVDTLSLQGELCAVEFVHLDTWYNEVLFIHISMIPFCSCLISPTYTCASIICTTLWTIFWESGHLVGMTLIANRRMPVWGFDGSAFWLYGPDTLVYASFTFTDIVSGDMYDIVTVIHSLTVSTCLMFSFSDHKYHYYDVM